MMPHKIFQPDDFLAKTQELRGRFSLQAEDSLFLANATETNVPADGLPVFVDQTWKVIRTQKELNLPGQREMVANYRCNEMKDEAVAKVKAQIEELKRQSDRQIIENFGESCASVVQDACNFYQEVAKQYNPEVFQKILQELKEHLLSSLYHCFDSQLKLLR